MDAIRTVRCLFTFVGGSLLGTLSAQAQLGPASMRGAIEVRSKNFAVTAATEALAQEVARAAEQQRQELAVHWLGQPLPNWSQPCPIKVTAGPNIGAGGSTTFTLSHGAVGHWLMKVQGSRERILDSVLPHEITHTILASHFAPLGRPVPRWADEGACTTVEHASEKSKHDHFLVQFLSQGRGIPFAVMFALKEYPDDIMPLYAQGYSVSSFLIAQGGPRRFVQFLEDGMRTEDWVAATDKHYSYPMIGKLQSAWNKWVGDGGGSVAQHTADALGVSRRALVANNSAPTVGPNSVVLIGATQPINNAIESEPRIVTNPFQSSKQTTPLGAESWYKRQLNNNSQPTDETKTNANLAGQSVSSPANFGTDFSSSQPQSTQTLNAAQPPNWAGGPSFPMYR